MNSYILMLCCTEREIKRQALPLNKWNDILLFVQDPKPSLNKNFNY